MPNLPVELINIVYNFHGTVKCHTCKNSLGMIDNKLFLVQWFYCNADCRDFF